MTSQCVIKHYLSATKVHAEYVRSIQLRERTIYREGEQDYSKTEPLGDTSATDFEITKTFLR